MVSLIALRDLPYISGRRVAKGEYFSVSASDARVLKLGKMAKDAEPAKPWRDVTSGEMIEPEPEVKSKRTYRRRDLNVEPA